MGLIVSNMHHASFKRIYDSNTTVDKLRNYRSRTNLNDKRQHSHQNLSHLTGHSLRKNCSEDLHSCVFRFILVVILENVEVSSVSPSTCQRNNPTKHSYNIGCAANEKSSIRIKKFASCHPSLWRDWLPIRIWWYRCFGWCRAYIRPKLNSRMPSH